MSKSKGTSAGVSGLLDVPGAAGAKLHGIMFGFGQKMVATRKPRRGRGGTRWAGARTLVSSGTIGIYGQVDLGIAPLPSGAWEDQEGTLTIQVGYAGDTPQTEVITVRVLAAEFKTDEKSEDLTDFVVTCEITSPTTWAGFAGSQPAAVGPSKSDQEQWGEGTTKTQDPNGLTSAATRTTDVWGGTLPDTDSGEATRLATMVAAAQAPLTGLKLRTATFTRDSTDGGTVMEVWGLNNTADDQTHPRTTTTTDANGLTSVNTTAAIIDPGSPPATPAAPSGFKLGTTEDVLLVDGKSVRVYRWVLADSKDAKEFENTKTLIDPNALRTQVTLGAVFTNGSPPDDPGYGSLKTVEYFDAPLTATDTSNQSLRVWRYGPNDSIDDTLNPKTTRSDDPQHLKGTVDIAVFVGGDNDPPATPAGYKLALTLDALLPEGPTVRVYRYALVDSKDEAEFERTRTTTDPNDLTSEAATGAVFTTGSPPSTPSAPAGLKLVDYFDVPLTASDTSDKSIRVYRWGLLDSIDKLVLPDTVASEDPNGLTSRETTSAVDGSAPAASIAGLVLRTTKTTVPAPGRTQQTAEHGVRSTVDDEEMPDTFVEADPDLIASRGQTAKVYTTAGGEPADATPPLTELKVVATVVKELDRTNSKKLTKFDTATTAEKIELDGTEAQGDPDDLEDREDIRVVTDSATPPAAPTPTLANVVLRGNSIKELPAGQYAHTFRFRTTTAQDDIENDGSETVNDASDLEDSQKISLVQGSSTPSAPSTPSGLVLVDTKTKKLNDAKWRHTFYYGLLTNKEKIEHNATSAVNDAIQSTASSTGTIIACLSTDTAISLAATAYTANRVNAAFKNVRVQKINKTQALKIIELANDDKRITRSFPPARYEDMKALPGGFGTTAAYVHVAELPGPLIGGPGGYSAARLSHYTVLRQRGIVTLRRRIICANSAAVATAYQLSLSRTVNNASFLGYGANTLMMGGASGVNDWALVGGSHLFVADYHMAYDEHCHPNDSRFGMGWTTCDGTTLINALGDVVASTYFGALQIMLWPTASDFAGLLA